MGRILPACCMAALTATLMLLPQPGDAQVRSASRHAARDQAEAAHARHAHLQELFDVRETEAAMELGNGSLRGVMAHAMKPGRRLAKLLSRTSTAVADREWVFLLPMTAHVDAWYRTADNPNLREHDFKLLHPGIWKYAGRVRTDTEGNFEFSGLKPGRYLVFAEFPVVFETESWEDTGRRSISYSYAFGSGSIDPVYRKVYGEQYQVIKVGQVVTVREGAPTSYRAVVE